MAVVHFLTRTRVAVLIGLVLLAGCGRQAASSSRAMPLVAMPPETGVATVARPSPIGAAATAPAPRATAHPPSAQPSVTPRSTAVAAPDAVGPHARELAVCRRFLDWAERYRAADPTGRAALEAEGLALARERRVALATLVRADPRQALLMKLPLRERATMPPGIVAQLERRLASEGRFASVARLPSGDAGPDGDQRSVVPMVIVGNQQFESSTYGRRLGISSKHPVPVHGIVLDGVAAVHEDAVRPLEPGEAVDPAATPSNPDLACPVSGRDGGVVADVGGKPVYLCSSGHIRTLNEQFASAEAGGGRTARSPYTEGAKTVLYIRARFTDQADSDLPSDSTCQNTVAGMSAFFNEMSYGRLSSFTATVTPVVVLTGTAASYGSNDGKVRTDALAAARAAGFEPNDFDFDAVRYQGGPGGFSGQAYVGARGVWMKTDSVGVAVHEFGHNLGLWHANFWTTSNGSPIGPGTVSEYGNSFDTMGAATANNNHFNAGSKQLLGWLPTSNIHQPSSSGVFRLFPQDHATLLPSTQKQSLRVVKDAARHYIIEFRQRFASSLWQMNGVTVKWNSPSNSDGGDLLLDTTPGTPDGKNDAAVVIGRTFTDRAASIHITPIGLGGTTPQSIDVVVNQGTFPGNQSPSLTTSGPATAPINTAISLVASASDPDAGDSLAYAWDFGDRTVSTTNSATVSKAWGAAGSYVVRCTVSDMKGGVASVSHVVTVGTPTVFAIRGRVLDGAAGVQGVRIHNGQSGNTYRGTVTDSDGTYILGNLNAGPVTVSASSPLYTLSASFANPVTVGPDATGRDFTATRLDDISITALDANAAETGSDAASFRLSRTTTGAARPVTVALSGSAILGSDYTLAGGSITVSGTNGTVTFPAGQATVDVVLTAINDSITEGAETAIVTLGDSSAYGLLAPTSATATIAGVAGPANDAFVNRIALNGFPVNTTGSSLYASKETGEPAHDGVPGGHSVWWTWTAPTSGSCTIDLSGSGFDTVLAVYTGSTLGGLGMVTSDDDSGSGATSRVAFTASAGTTYQIAVDGYSATAQGAITLALNLGTMGRFATITASDANATEGIDTGTFTVTLSPTSTSATTIPFSVTGSASAGGDYTALSGSVVVAANTPSATITVTPANDATPESPETVIVTLGSGTGYDVGSPATATVTVSDAPPPVATITATDANATEAGPTTGTFTVSLSRPAPAVLSIDYTVTGTASPADHQPLTIPLVIAVGASSGTIVITPVDDSTIEGGETVVATLVQGTGYTLGGSASASIAITDNDAPLATITASSTGASEAGPTAATFTITLDAPTTTPITVALALTGTASLSDYQSLSAAVAIAAGGTSGTLIITPVDDALYEPTETFIATITAGVGYTPGAPADATLTIADNDPPPPGSSNVASSGSSGGGGGCGMGSSFAMLALALTLLRPTGRRRG